jgi:hypothetical protein
MAGPVNVNGCEKESQGAAPTQVVPRTVSKGAGIAPQSSKGVRGCRSAPAERGPLVGDTDRAAQRRQCC